MGVCCSTHIDFDADVELAHFQQHRILGKGSTGKVRAVEHKKTGKIYALKYVNKSRSIRDRTVSNVIQERKLLEQMEHPFIVNLHFAFQDQDNCFLVLDFMEGGDLRFHLNRTKIFSEDQLRFWVTELASAMSYLHSQGIIHRDIKPDNILLDMGGHAHLSDFNSAFPYSPEYMYHADVGTASYMAPELINREGYSWEVDWWSLGVTIYELCFHELPFKLKTPDQLLQSILNVPLVFPSDVVHNYSLNALSVVSGLVCKDPMRRLGCKYSPRGAKVLHDLKMHPWFQGVNWSQVANKDIRGPFTPQKMNFDNSHEIDQYISPEKPLDWAQRIDPADIEKLSPERRRFEHEFLLYDRTKLKCGLYHSSEDSESTLRSSQSFHEKLVSC